MLVAETITAEKGCLLNKKEHCFQENNTYRSTLDSHLHPLQSIPSPSTRNREFN